MVQLALLAISSACVVLGSRPKSPSAMAGAVPRTAGSWKCTSIMAITYKSRLGSIMNVWLSVKSPGFPGAAAVRLFERFFFPFLDRYEGQVPPTDSEPALGPLHSRAMFLRECGLPRTVLFASMACALLPSQLRKSDRRSESATVMTHIVLLWSTVRLQVACRPCGTCKSPTNRSWA
jgi:hypothetical protein